MNRPFIALNQVVLKLHSRCDLACDHCYVYEAADQSWRGRPAVVSEAMISRAAQRIAEHAMAHALPSVQVVLHGGEPLLAGPARLRHVITELRAALAGVCHLDLRIHSNGVLLTENLCQLFAEQDVRVGISIDGDRAANDRHRRYADGRSSYDKVLRAIGLLRTDRFRHLYAGLLCTIDLANDPLVVYRSLMDLGPPRIDFLLPHATWENPPVRAPGADSEYAGWLISIFDRWLAEGRPVRIRTFDSILSTLHGGESLTEALGLGPVGLVVIETDGGYEQADSLKAAFDGAPETGMNVFEHSMDEVARHPGILARQRNMAGLSQACQECPVVSSCGGGLYAHRYREQNGFDNPSVYCADLLALVSHVKQHLPADGPDATEVRVHSMTGAQFRSLAAGAGDADAVGRLVEGQRSLVRGLVSAVYQMAASTSPVPAAGQARLREAWKLLATLDRERPDALAAVLGHPYLRVWAELCLEQMNSAGHGAGEGQVWEGTRPIRTRGGQGIRDLAADLGHLGAIAAAAAARAGMVAAVGVPVVSASVHLPTLGRLILGPREVSHPEEAEPGLARVSVIANAVIIRVGASCWTLDRAALLAGTPRADAAPGNSRSGEWQPIRILRAGRLEVALDDIDQYRDCGPWPGAPRLTEAEAGQWERAFRAAWQEIQHQHAGYAPALAAGLTTLTPLAANSGGCHSSAGAGRVLGAASASAPAGPGRLALRLIEELQCGKLSALLDLYDLYDRADDRVFPAPWAEGKLQIDGLMRCAYACLGAADFWRVRQEHGDGPAERRFRECRAQTGEAAGTLLDSGALTALGRRFVQGMHDSVSALAGPSGRHQHSP